MRYKENLGKSAVLEIVFRDGQALGVVHRNNAVYVYKSIHELMRDQEHGYSGVELAMVSPDVWESFLENSKTINFNSLINFKSL